MIQFMKQIGIFILLGKTILHFCPCEKYEKYLKLLFGFMVTIQFVSPVLSFGNGSTMQEYEKNKADFEQKMEESLKDVEEKWFLYDEEIATKIEKNKTEAESMMEEKAAKEKEAAESTSDSSVKAVEEVEIEVTVHE